MRINLALLLLVAAFSANAVEIKLTFNEIYSPDWDYEYKSFLISPGNPHTGMSVVYWANEPRNQLLGIGGQTDASFQITALDGSNISSFAVQSFHTIYGPLPEGPENAARLSATPLSEQGKDLLSRLPQGEFVKVKLKRPIYTDRFEFGIVVENSRALGLFDNIKLDVVWGKFDISAIADLSADAQPDFTLLPLWGSPEVSGVASSDGATIITSDYLTRPWQPIAQDVVSDGNADGVSDDPLVAVLAQNSESSKITVEVRELPENSPSDELSFFNGQYVPIDIAVLNDTNGNGVHDDPSIAVLAEKPSTGRQAIMLKRLRDGYPLGHWTITKQNQELVAIAGISLPRNNSRLSVLMRDTVTGSSAIHSFRVADGARLTKHDALGPAEDPRDLAIQADGDGNGIADDPVYVVLSEKASNGNHMASLSAALTGVPIDKFRVLNSDWTAHRIAVSPDLSGDGFPDLLTVATGDEDGRLIVNVRELDSGDQVKNLFPVIPNPAN